MTAKTIKQLIDAYQSGEYDLADYLTTCLAKASQDTHNVWIECISDAQLQGYIQALQTQERVDLPLYGVPFAIKDNIDLAGLPTTAGCREYLYQPEQSAFVVELLIAAGAVPIGKTNLDQFATGLVGTRSPWGPVKNSVNPDYISGGSSSGSAVAVATEQVWFALGTDTAGSGRVPAAFNNLFGLKPTKGTLSCQGVVPACRSLDCVTFFTRSAQDLTLLYQAAARYDAGDCYSRPLPHSTELTVHRLKGLKVGIPSTDPLAFFDDGQYQRCYEQAVQQVEACGAELVPFDLSPFIEAAKLLYDGPWVAERYAALQAFIDEDASRCLPVIETIIGGAQSLSAVDTFHAMYQLQAYKVQCDALMATVDVVMTPTAGGIFTIDEVNADPIRLNSQLGYYTNFMNLLDYSAIAIPSGFTEQGLPFGVTLFAPAFADWSLMAIADDWQQAAGLPLGAGQTYLDDDVRMDLLVCGAHMAELPLNYQLQNIGGYLKQVTQTSANYRFYALAGGPPMRPGMVRDEAHGSAIEVEIWRVKKSGIGQLLSAIPHPLGLGTVELSDGTWVKGFICESIGIEGAEDITELGGWRQYLTR